MVKVVPRLWFWYNSIAWTRTSHCNVILIVATLIAAVASTVNGITWSTRNYVKLTDGNLVAKESIERSMLIVHDIATENLGSLCVSKSYRPLEIPINPARYENSREKVELAALILQDVGINRHGGLLDALAKGLLSDDHVIGARILAMNITSGVLGTSIWWMKNGKGNSNIGIGEPIRIEEEGIQIGKKPNTNYPWFEDEISSPGLRSPKFAPSPPNISFKGWWTYPYYSCTQRKWILSYSIAIPPMGRHSLRGFLSIDIDITNLKVNQCDYPTTIAAEAYEMLRFPKSETETDTALEIEAFRGSHKCHRTTMMCEYRMDVVNWSSTATTKVLTNTNGWARGAYKCFCKRGFYSARHPKGFNGTIMEVAYQEFRDNISTYYLDVFQCYPCAPGCGHCLGPEPCLAEYNWPFRISLLIISISCAISTIMLAAYMFRHRKMKVFKVASPIFLLITLIGCAIMYLEMAAIFPVLDTYFCIATKWTRHMGFCITYTSLLMKTWRVSLTYRVKSAHKVKLTDKQLLQWMVPILLVMLIYLGTWTISATPYAENIRDADGLKFKQCSYNWWDHSLAIGEVLFLAWGIRVCYNVRNAESLYNEARLISYAIYNIATVNITAVAFHLFIFPQAGPDIKYFLGFVRTQLSTTVTIALVFGPKVLRVLRGQGDQWDNKARVRSITASFSLNGVGLVPEDSPDLYQENEELKEEIQKLAHQIEFMKTVHMQMNNRHLKPKPGGYFTITSTSFQSPFGKSVSAQTQTSSKPSQPNSCVSDDGHSGSNSLGANSIGYPTSSIPAQPAQNNSVTDKV